MQHSSVLNYQQNLQSLIGASVQKIHHIKDGILHIYFVPRQEDLGVEQEVVLYVDGNWELVNQDGQKALTSDSAFEDLESFAQNPPLNTVQSVQVARNGKQLEIQFSQLRLTVFQSPWGLASLKRVIVLSNGKYLYIHDRLTEDLAEFEHREVIDPKK